MCFIPFVSLIIAITELLIAYVMYKKIKDKKLYPVVFFVIFLALYQISEIFLCKSDNPVFWSRVGFMIYTFLPVLIYHFCTNVAKVKFHKIVYLIPIFFVLLDVFDPNFIRDTTCNQFHISSRVNFINDNLLLMLIYLWHYFFFSVFWAYILLSKIRKKPKLSIKSWAVIVPLWILLAILYNYWLLIYNDIPFQTPWNIIILMSIILLIIVLLLSICIKSKKKFYKLNLLILASTWIIIVFSFAISPELKLNFSSVFCQFAILYAFLSLIIVKMVKWKQIK